MTGPARGSSADADATDTYEAIYRTALSWLRENWDPDLTVRQWWARLANAGWSFPSWPRNWFGHGLNPLLVPAVGASFAETGALRPPQSNGQWLAAPTLMTHGSEAQRAAFLPALATGEEYWCQFFSEPGSGSDLASLATRAIRDGNGWIVNGQKVWTTGGQYADRGMLLARTNVGVPKHQGITFFVIDVDQPGIEVRPLIQMNGNSTFSEVFFTDARVSNDRIVGGLNNGWKVAMATLAFERFPSQAGVMCGAKTGLLDLRAGDVADGTVPVPAEGARPFGQPADLVRAAANEVARGGDPLVRQHVASVETLARIGRFTGLRSSAATQSGRLPGSEGSVRKLDHSRLDRAGASAAFATLGAQGMLVGPEAATRGLAQNMAMTSFASSIGGGTEEIQRNILGERVLGLPKEPAVDRGVPYRELRVGTQPRE
jgi:alkylation response protein AidB-like acyl-CoA dehydrogenase